MDRGMRRDDFEEVDKFRRKANVLCWLLAICCIVHSARHPSAREGEQRGSSRAT